MIKRGIQLIWLAMAYLPTLSRATSVISMDLNDLSQKAETVLYGQVVEIQLDAHTHKRVAIVQTIENAKCQPEDCPKKEFRVQLLNRLMPDGETAEVYLGAPELKLNEKVVLYLNKIKNSQNDLYAIAGFHQGKLKVYRDSNGLKKVAGPFEIPPPAFTLKSLILPHSLKRQIYKPNDIENLPPLKRQVQGKLKSLEEVLALARSFQMEKAQK